MTAQPIFHLTVTLFPAGAAPAAQQPAWGMPAVIPVGADITQWIDRRTAERYGVLPLRRNGPVLLVAIANTPEAQIIADLTQLTRLRIRAVPASAADIRQAIDVLYPPAEATAEAARLPLGQLLLARGLITTGQLERALIVAAETGEKLGKIAVSLGYVNRLALSQVLAEQAGLPHVNLRDNRPTVEVARLLPQDLARRLQAVPVRWLDNDRLIVTLATPGWETPPAPPTVPDGPIETEASGKKSRMATYQDLLQSPHDEALFMHLATAQLATWVGAGKVFLFKSACIQQRHGQRVAHGQLRGGAGGWG